MSQSNHSVVDRSTIFEVHRGPGPIVATAIHDGHELRPEVSAALGLDDDQRRREEDPFTWVWTDVGHNRVRVHRSRFEVDLNRPRDKAVYRGPEDAWGLDLWDGEPGPSLVTRSLAEYDAFYGAIELLLSRLERRFGGFIVYDIHSYNHRRGGVVADPAMNPTVNLGTGSLDASRWGGIVAAFLSELRTHTINGVQIDARENVRFTGGYFSRWVHETFPRTGCSLSIDVRKSFMDEETGAPDLGAIEDVRAALAATSAPVVRTFAEIVRGPAT